MTVSPRVRFDIFERDRFTCTYCGRTPPHVLLELDHVIPRARDGSDDPSNLTTSCEDCNRGKAARLLNPDAVPMITPDAIDRMEERIAQSEAFARLAVRLRELEDDAVATVIDAWAHCFGAKSKELKTGTWWVFTGDQQFPDTSTIRRLLKIISLADILEAVDITGSRKGLATYWTCRYFYGICWRKADQARGR
jgi:hypothetical protein